MNAFKRPEMVRSWAINRGEKWEGADERGQGKRKGKGQGPRDQFKEVAFCIDYSRRS